MASLIIRPGSRIRLKGQDTHVPDFIVVRCERDRCWIRQQGWGPETELKVRFTQILVPSPDTPPSEGKVPAVAASNVIYLDDYRLKKTTRDFS